MTNPLDFVPAEVCEAAQSLWERANSNLDEAITNLASDMGHRISCGIDDQTVSFGCSLVDLSNLGTNDDLLAVYLAAMYRLASQRLAAEFDRTSEDPT